MMQFLVSMDLQLNGAVGAQLAIIDRASGIYSLFAAITHTHFVLEPDHLCQLRFPLYLEVNCQALQSGDLCSVWSGTDEATCVYS